eukprot:5019675-Pyramimonas_sp.AAC.3
MHMTWNCFRSWADGGIPGHLRGAPLLLAHVLEQPWGLLVLAAILSDVVPLNALLGRSPDLRTGWASPPPPSRNGKWGDGRCNAPHAPRAGGYFAWCAVAMLAAR